jgi:hypothetical protein
MEQKRKLKCLPHSGNQFRLTFIKLKTNFKLLINLKF